MRAGVGGVCERDRSDMVGECVREVETSQCRGSVCGRGGRVLRAIMRNFFGYVVISIGSKRNVFSCVVAEKWLKRNKSISGILCEGRSEIGESVCWVCGVVLSTAVRRFLYSRAVVSDK